MSITKIQKVRRSAIRLQLSQDALQFDLEVVVLGRFDRSGQF